MRGLSDGRDAARADGVHGDNLRERMGERRARRSLACSRARLVARRAAPIRVHGSPATA